MTQIRKKNGQFSTTQLKEFLKAQVLFERLKAIPKIFAKYGVKKTRQVFIGKSRDQHVIYCILLNDNSFKKDVLNKFYYHNWDSEEQNWIPDETREVSLIVGDATKNRLHLNLKDFKMHPNLYRWGFCDQINFQQTVEDKAKNTVSHLCHLNDPINGEVCYSLDHIVMENINDNKGRNSCLGGFFCGHTPPCIMRRPCALSSDTKLPNPTYRDMMQKNVEKL